MLLHCWKATLRASGKPQALHGPSPSQVLGSFSGMKVRREAGLLPSPMAEQLGSQAPSLPLTLGCYVGWGYLWVAQGAFMGLEGGGCPIGVIINHLLCTSLRSLVQAMQHRAAPPHCRAHPGPTGVPGEGGTVPSLEITIGSLSASQLFSSAGQGAGQRSLCPLGAGSRCKRGSWEQWGPGHQAASDPSW